jgi:signal transduction histidine kinase
VNVRAVRWSVWDGLTVRRLLDGAIVLLILVMYLGFVDPDLLRDAMWVVLAIGAFVFGFRATMLRIAVVLVLGYAYVAYVAPREGVLTEFDPFELTEAPLVVLISAIVALMADRMSKGSRHNAELYRQASERLNTAHEEERATLARDLHDGLGQTLTAALLTLDAAGAALEGDPDVRQRPLMTENARQAVGRARDLVGAALDEARDVAARLRPLRIREVGFGAALSAMAGSAGVPVEVRFDPRALSAGPLDAERQLHAYRIVQEAVGNAARHSRARTIWIDASASDDGVTITVGDDGLGFERPMVPVGSGLEVMDERAAIIGARLDVRSSRGAGTIVTLFIPGVDLSPVVEERTLIRGAEAGG